jgi:hypothetical protein
VRLITLLFAVFIPVAAGAQSTAFVHVNLVPMDSERVLRDQTVLVRDGHIEAVGAALAPPPGYQLVDGHGTAWLSPGLADMHTHSETRDDLALYLANGVTTVLNMGGARANLVDSIVQAVHRGGGGAGQAPWRGGDRRRGDLQNHRQPDRPSRGAARIPCRAGNGISVAVGFASLAA